MIDSKLIDLHLKADGLAKEAQEIADWFFKSDDNRFDVLAQSIGILESEYSRLRVAVIAMMTEQKG